MLTQAQVKELFDYDPETGIIRWMVRKGSVQAGTVAGSPNDRGYIQIRIDKTTYRAHRLAWLIFYGRWPENQIDHINGIRTDNRIKNLREANAAQNAQNQRTASSDNKSGYLGVSVFRNKWQAQIMVNGKNRYIGVYDTPEEAHEAYLAKKRELHEFNTL